MNRRCPTKVPRLVKALERPEMAVELGQLGGLGRGESSRGQKGPKLGFRQLLAAFTDQFIESFPIERMQ